MGRKQHSQREWREKMNLALMILISIAAFGQNVPSGALAGTATVREPQAIAVVEQALAALGGHEAHKQVRTTVIKGTTQEWDAQVVSSFLWEDDVSGKVPEFRKEIRSGDTVRTFVSGHGTPAHLHEGRSTQVPLQSALAAPPLHLPGVVLARELGNPSYSFRVIQDSGGGLLHVQAAWKLNPGTISLGAQDWYFDPTTKLPVRVQYLLPDTQKPGHTMAAAIEFSDFRNVSGIGVPFQMRSHGASGGSRLFTVTDAQTNGSIAASKFEVQGEQQ